MVQRLSHITRSPARHRCRHTKRSASACRASERESARDALRSIPTMWLMTSGEMHNDFRPDSGCTRTSGWVAGGYAATISAVNGARVGSSARRVASSCSNV